MYKFCVFMFCAIYVQHIIAAEKPRVVILEPGHSIIHQDNLSSLKPNLCIYCYKGAEKNVLRLFETVELQMNIDGQDYQQYEGSNPQEVLEHYEEHRSLFSFTLFSQKRTRLQLYPFETKCLGIETKHSYEIRLMQLRVDFWRVMQIAIACLCFFKARHLSNNSFFYYITGITLGICFSFILLIFLCSKLLPSRPLMYGAVVGGWAVGVYIIRLLWTNLQTILIAHRTYVLWYIAVTGVLSFFFCYRMGPPQNKRSKEIAKWVLQIMSLLVIYASCAFEEVAVVIMALLLLVHYFPIGLLNSARRWYLSKFPPKRRLLTNEEYYEQAVRETKKALEELRVFARSPECPQWKVMQKLRSPMRFAEFVEGASHLSDSELLEYENSVDQMDEEDEEEEIASQYSLDSFTNQDESSVNYSVQVPRGSYRLNFDSNHGGR